MGKRGINETGQDHTLRQSMRKHGTNEQVVSQGQVLVRKMGRVALSGSRRRAGARGEYDILSRPLVETLDGHRYSKYLFEWMSYAYV